MVKFDLRVPAIEMQQFVHIATFQSRLYMQYSAVVEGTPEGRELMRQLSADARVKSLEGLMINQGSSAGRFETKTLAMWFAWRANAASAEVAAVELESFLERQTLGVVVCLWLAGPVLSQPLRLSNGYSIVPTESMLDTSDKEAFLRLKIDDLPGARTRPSCAIVKECQVAKTSSPDGGRSDLTEHWKVESELSDIALVLNVLPGISCVPYYSTSYSLPGSPFGLFGSTGGGHTLYDVSGTGSGSLDTTLSEVIDELVVALKDRSGKDRSRFVRAIDRLSQAKRRNQYEDKILDLGIALEMMLLDDRQRDEQLSMLFRLRGSWLMGTSVESRLELSETLRDVYTYRSQVAHTGSVASAGKHSMPKLRRDFVAYLAIAESVFMKLLRDGSPDWTRTLVGGGHSTA